MKNKFITRLISGLLVAIMMVTSTPATGVFANVIMSRTLNIGEYFEMRDMIKKVSEINYDFASADTSHFVGFEWFESPDGATLYFPSESTLPRGTTIAFITTTVVLDIKEYAGLPSEAYNYFLASYATSMVDTAFSYQGFPRIDLTCSKEDAKNYLLDTTVKEDVMWENYAGGTGNKSKYPGLIMCNTRGNEDLTTIIGGFMDSKEMQNVGEGSVTIVDIFQKSGDVNQWLLKRLVNERGYCPRIIKYSSSSNTFSDIGSIPKNSELLDEICEDTGNCNYIICSALSPLMVPSFQDSDDVYCSLAYNGFLYTNAGYFCAKYLETNPLSATSTSPNDFKHKGFQLSDKYDKEYAKVENPYTVEDMSGKYDEMWLGLALKYDKLYDVVFGMTEYMWLYTDGQTYIPLNDMLLLFAFLSMYGYFINASGYISLKSIQNGSSTADCEIHSGRSYNIYQDLNYLYTLKYHNKIKASNRYEAFVAVAAYNLELVLKNFYSLESQSTPLSSRVSLTPITSLYNVSNVLSGMTYTMGTSGSPMYETSKANIRFNDMVGYYYSTLQCYYYPAGKDYIYQSTETNPFLVEVTYEGQQNPIMNNYVAGAKFFSTMGMTPIRMLQVSVEQDGDGVNEIIIPIPVRITDTVTIKAAGNSEEEEEACYKILKNFGSGGTCSARIFGVTGPEFDDTNKTLTFTKAEGASPNKMGYIEMYIDSSEIIGGDISFEVSATGAELLYDGRPTEPSGAYDKIIINARKDKEYEEDVTPRVEDKDKDKALVTLGGTDKPVSIVFKTDDAGTEIPDNELFELYEGCSYLFYPKFSTLPVGEGEAGTLKITCTPPAGEKIELELPYDADNPEALNEALKNKFKGYIEYHGVSFSGDYKSMPAIKVDYEFSSGSSFTGVTKVNVYKWLFEMEGKLENPATNVVKSNTDTDVKIVMSNELDRNKSDDGGVHAEGLYEVRHETSYLSNPLKEGGHALEGGILYTREGNVDGNSFYKTNIKDYSEASITGDYTGVLNMEEGTWTLTDECSIYIWSLAEGCFKEVEDDEMDIVLKVNDMEPLTARFEKDEAELNEAVGFEFKSFKASDMGLSSITNPVLTWEGGGGATVTPNINVSGNTVTISGTIAFSQKGKFTVGGFKVSCDEVTFDVVGDSGSFPYDTIVVPPIVDYKPFDIEVTPDEAEASAGEDGTVPCNYTITITATDDYEDWKANVDPLNEASFTFSLEDTNSNCSSTAPDTQANIGGNPSSSTSWTGTIGGISAGDNITANYIVRVNTGASEAKHMLTARMTFKYTNNDGSVVAKDSSDTGSYIIVVPTITPTPAPVLGGLEVGTETPYAVITSNMPDPDIWKWDVMNAIPCTETVAVSVGASEYNASVETLVVALGNAVTKEGRTHEKDKSDTPLTDPALTREIQIRVQVIDLWNAEESVRCKLSCDGHGNSHSCPSTSSIAHDGTITPCSYCGWTLSYSITCDQDALCDCCAETCDGAQDCSCEEPTEEEPNPPKCSACSHTCECSCSECPAGTKGCSGSDSGSEACPTGAETFHSITWNCGTNETTAESGGAATASCSGGQLNEYGQTYTDIKWSWSCAHCGGSGEGPYEFTGPIDHGYTDMSTHGCKCEENPNNAEHRGTKSWFIYDIVEQVDFLTYHKILTCMMGGLSHATIEEADDIYEDGTVGRNVLIGGTEAHIWCASDDSVLDNPYDTSANCAAQILGKGRIRYSSNGEAQYNGYGGETWLSSMNGANPAIFADSDKMTIGISAVANRDVINEMTEFKNQKLELEEGYLTDWGIQNDKYDGEEGSDGGFKDEHKGAYLTYDECKVFATHVVNDWLSHAWDKTGSNIGCYAISDCASYDDACLLTGSYISERIPLWNVSFKEPFGEPMYRVHCTGTTASNETLAKKYQNAFFSDFKGGSSAWIGYSGNYTPESQSDMYKRTEMAGRIGDAVELLLTEFKTPERCTYGPGGGYMAGTAGGFDYSAYGTTSGGGPGSPTDEGEIIVDADETVLTLRNDEFFAPSVEDVSASSSVRGESDSGTSTSVDGEYLLPIEQENPDSGEIFLRDNQTFAFLGIQFKPNTKNGLYRESMKVKVTHTPLIAYNNDAAASFGATPVTMDDTEETTCQFTKGDTSSINPVVIANPIGIDVFIYDNTFGANNSIYAIDESKEDFRTNDAGKGTSHIVIGNTFNVWVSEFIDDSAESDKFNLVPTTTSWSRDNNACDPGTGEPNPASGGTGKSLYTHKWARKCEMSFSFPVSYIDDSGTEVKVPAGGSILLWEKLQDATGAYTDEVIYVSGSTSAPPTGDVDYMGTKYTFTCDLSAEETRAGSCSVILYGINPNDDSSITFYSNVNGSRSELVADDMVTSSASCPIIGRIGDLAITDTQDYRFSNTFWEDDDTWLIPGIVKNSTAISKKSLRAQYNLLRSDSPVYGSLNSSDSGSISTGLTDKKENLPLSSSIQDLPEFDEDNLGLGYNAYISLSTMGEYTGKLGSAEYPESILEEGGTDTRTNRLLVWPKYVLYDLDEDKFYDIKLFAGTETNYDLYWSREDWTPNYANEISLSMDEEAEQLRYCVSDFAKNYSLLYNDNMFSAFTDYVYQGTANRIILDERSNIVTGAKYDNARPVSYDKSANKFTWEHDGSTYTTRLSAVTHGSMSDADYAVNTRRWFFSLGLPSSSIVTYTNPGDNALSIKNNHEKLLKEHPNSVIVCFADIYAEGAVYDLQYDYLRCNGSTAIDICGNSVDFNNTPVYINDDVSYRLNSSWAPLFVTDVERTSTQDLTQEGTH